MSAASHFPLLLPKGDHRPFATGEVVRRLVHVGGLEEGSRVLLAGGAAVLPFCSDSRAQLVVSEPDADEAARVRGQVAAEGLDDRVSVRSVALDHWPESAERFHAVALLGEVPMPFDVAVKQLRQLVVPSGGRLALTYPVRVSRELSEEVQAFWRERLGEPLRWPRELFMALERGGFESEDALTLDEHALEALYASAGAHRVEAGGPEVTPFDRELALHRAQAGRTGVTYALLVGRRKESGDVPFTSRDRG
ncbi:MAG: SAM-dependent methyltransferase [Myxococcaceae bacterium]|nr:SAM-dependent methyltransferase [Myxococcaceae bacterium]MCI0669518.1 SAM-dependent methyltransferase [Myxococcaceae bacterium]